MLELLRGGVETVLLLCLWILGLEGALVIPLVFLFESCSTVELRLLSNSNFLSSAFALFLLSQFTRNKLFVLLTLFCLIRHPYY